MILLMRKPRYPSSPRNHQKALISEKISAFYFFADEVFFIVTSLKFAEAAI